MKRFYLIYLLISTLIVQSQANHWESVVLPGDLWQYLTPTSQPNSNWNQLDFNASSWNTGNSGFGY